MENFVSILNPTVALGSLVVGVFGIVLLVLYISSLRSQSPLLEKVTPRLSWIGFLVAGTAAGISLIYSGVVGYAPCDWCWWQRIFIYPQVIIYLIAILRKDKNIFIYTFFLSILGIIVALYHNWIDLGGTQFIACGTAVSCTQRFVYEFGFVTIPLMSLLGLFTLAVISWIGFKKQA